MKISNFSTKYHLNSEVHVHLKNIESHAMYGFSSIQCPQEVTEES